MQRPLVTSDTDFARDLCGTAALFASPHDAQENAAALASLSSSVDLRHRLVALGHRQLLAMYPTVTEKFLKQMQILHQLARHTPPGGEGCGSSRSGNI
jgi:hypothetical protein